MTVQSHFVFFQAGLPSHSNHGGAQTCMGLIEEMRREGHAVTLLSLYDINPKTNPYLKDRTPNEETLKKLGVPIRFVEFDQENDSRFKVYDRSHAPLEKLKSHFLLWTQPHSSQNLRKH